MSPESSPGAQEIARAAAALDLGKLDLAEEHARKAIAVDPENFVGYAILSSVFLGRSSLNEAASVARDGLAKAPHAVWLLRNLASAQLGLGQHESALEVTEQALKLEPESAPTHYLRSLALEAIGNLDEAVEEVMKAVELDPEDSNYHRQLGDIYVHGNPLAAEKWYRNALKLNPNDVRALNNLGVVLLATKREAQARMAYRAALLLDPALDVAKLNVHRSISNQFKRLSRGVVYPPLFVLGITCSLHMILAAVAWLGCSSLDAVLKSHRYAMILLLIYGAPLLYFPIAILSSYIYKSWQLRRTDPQLYHLYKRIAEDKERGRL